MKNMILSTQCQSKQYSYLIDFLFKTPNLHMHAQQYFFSISDIVSLYGSHKENIFKCALWQRRDRHPPDGIHKYLNMCFIFENGIQ